MVYTSRPSCTTRGPAGRECWHLRSCVNNGETGIALPIEMSFIPPEEVLQIALVAVLRDQKCGGNRGVSIDLHEFADKWGTDSLSVEELPDALRFLLLHIASAFLHATEHIVEPSHHFLSFLRIEEDPDAVLACQEVRRPVYLGGGCRQMMTLQQGFHLGFGC